MLRSVCRFLIQLQPQAFRWLSLGRLDFLERQGLAVKESCDGLNARLSRSVVIAEKILVDKVSGSGESTGGGRKRQQLLLLRSAGTLQLSNQVGRRLCVVLSMYGAGSLQWWKVGRLLPL